MSEQHYEQMSEEDILNSDDNDMSDDVNEMDEVEPKNENDPIQQETLPQIEVQSSPIEDISMAKQRIAYICTSMISDPNGFDFPHFLKELLSFCVSPNPAIAGLSRFSATKVFGDMRPDYRIKVDELSGHKKGTISIGVRKRVTFEQNLLSYYGKFISLLKQEITKPSFKRLLQKGNIVKTAIAQILLKVVCDLLKSCWHFNFNLTLIDLSMTFLFSSREEFSLPASEALQEVIKSDLRGDVVIEIIRRIAQTVQKMNFNCHPNTLRPFLVIDSINEEINPFHIKTNNRKEQSTGYVQHTKGQFSRKKLKEFRIERKIDKEVKLTETKYSEEEKKKYNMLTLDTIFRTYFRILKTNQDSPLIPMVLEGMSLHTYKINFDFMLDIIKLLQNLIETRSNRLQPIDTVRVCYTIFNTLKLQKFLVTIDNIQFYESMYRVLLQIPLFQHIFEEEGNCEKLVECLKVMLLDIKQVPTLRVAAFVKRLMCIILNCNSVISLQLCKLLSLVLRRYYKDFIGMFEQESGNGEYLIDASQPDHSNALNSCFWEFVLLQQHPNPEIQKWVAEIKRLYKR